MILEKEQNSRLIVLLPESLVGDVDFAQKVSRMASRTQKDVLYLTLLDDPETCVVGCTRHRHHESCHRVRILSRWVRFKFRRNAGLKNCSRYSAAVTRSYAIANNRSNWGCLRLSPQWTTSRRI